jgi:proteasome lid subunit RPN8/RPN11
MTEPGFTIDGVRHEVPFRPRSHFTGYDRFADASGAVLVAPHISQCLRAAAGLARPNETGGLLSGRVFRDADSPYVIVTGCVEAPRAAGRPFDFRLSPEAASRLRGDATRAQPTADVVGWWHSHRSPSEYSETDLGQQRIWTHPQSVGVLVFATGRQWGAVYQGPSARLLRGQAGGQRPAELASQAAGRPGFAAVEVSDNPTGICKLTGRQVRDCTCDRHIRRS